MSTRHRRGDLIGGGEAGHEARGNDDRASIRSGRERVRGGLDRDDGEARIGVFRVWCLTPGSMRGQGS